MFATLKRGSKAIFLRPPVTGMVDLKNRGEKGMLQKKGKKNTTTIRKPTKNLHTGELELQRLSGHFLPHPNQERSVLAAFTQSSLNFQREALCCSRPFQGLLAVPANKREASPGGAAPWARWGNHSLAGIVGAGKKSTDSTRQRRWGYLGGTPSKSLNPKAALESRD